MYTCKFAITTSVDGQENAMIRMGQFNISGGEFLLTYQEENASVSVSIKKGIVLIDRYGDYSLHLTLEQGKTVEGNIGIGDSSGTVLAKTHHIKYSMERGVFKLSLGYDLLFGDETQKMRLKLRGQIKG